MTLEADQLVGVCPPSWGPLITTNSTENHVNAFQIVYDTPGDFSISMYADNCGQYEEPTLITIAGSTTVLPLMEVAAAEFMVDHPSCTMAVSGIGSSAGIAAVAGQTADIGMISKAWGGVDAAANPTLVATTIAYDGVVVAISEAAASAHGVTPALLGALTQDIIHDVYDGTITTWGAFVTTLGGISSDADPINLYQRAEASGTEDAFCEMILGEGKTYLDGTSTEGVQGNPGMITALQQDDNGIGFTSFGYAEANDLVCFSLNGVAPSHTSIRNGEYDGSRPLVILTNGVANGIVRQFIDYILDEENNNAFVAQVGYTSLY